MTSSSLAGAVEGWIGALLSGLDVRGHGHDAWFLVHVSAAVAVGASCAIVASTQVSVMI